MSNFYSNCLILTSLMNIGFTNVIYKKGYRKKNLCRDKNIGFTNVHL